MLSLRGDKIQVRPPIYRREMFFDAGQVAVFGHGRTGGRCPQGEKMGPFVQYPWSSFKGGRKK